MEGVIAAGVFGITAAILGTAVGFVLSRRGTKDDREAAAEAAEKTRLRDYELARVGIAREWMLTQLDLANAISSGASDLAKRLAERAGDLREGDIRLVGDLEAVRLYYEVMGDLQKTWPKNFAERAAWPLHHRGGGYDQMSRVAEARLALTAALDNQERRLLTDEPLTVIDPADMATVIDGETLIAQMRDVFGS